MAKYLISFGSRTFKVVAESNYQARQKAIAMWMVSKKLQNKISAVKLEEI